MAGQERFLQPGEVLFREGDAGDEMYLIKSGKIKISKVIENTETVLAILKEGDFFGEMAIIDGSPRSATATAIEPTELIIFDKDAFMAQVSENPLIEYVLETLIKRLRATNEQVKFLRIKSEEKRVIALLLSKAAEGTSTDMGVELPITYSPDSLAALVGVDPDRIEEIINTLSKANLVRVEGSKLYVRSVKDLEEYFRYITLKEKFGV